MIQAGSRTLHSEIQKLIHSIWNTNNCYISATNPLLYLQKG